MNDDFLKPALTALAKLQTALEEKGGPSEDGELFEQILSIQDEILRKCGLPINPDNENQIWFSQLPTNYDVKNRVKQLYKSATEYLLSDAETDKQILRDAQEKQQDVMYVLPELKVKTHSYTIFVFNKILLKRKDNLENILHELKFTSTYPVILDAIGRIEQGTIENEPEMTMFLENIGVRYLQQFFIHNSNVLTDDDY